MIKLNKIYIENISGFYRNLKNKLSILFLTIFIFTPFLRFDRGGDISNQAILIDIAERRLHFFAISIWPDELYYVVYILIISAVSLFLFTCLFGRIWCGFACPHTIWSDLFTKIEFFIIGDRNDKIKLDRNKISWKYLYKKLSIHILWLFLSLFTGIIFICYFNDSFAVMSNLKNPANFTFQEILWILIITGSTYIMAGFAREKLCKFMCPYSRFQSVMIDQKTMIIAYDEERGEPRGKLSKLQNNGDCINCYQCVNVCPQGIDIRDGLQMECISCGLCIDACNNIMKKINKKGHLIKYASIFNFYKNKKLKDIFNKRIIFYIAILALIIICALYNIINKDFVKLQSLHDRAPLYSKLSNGSIRNGYDIKIYNKLLTSKEYQLSYQITDKNIPSNILEFKLPINAKYDLSNLNIKANNIKEFKIFLILPRKYLDQINIDNIDIEFIIIDKNGVEAGRSKSIFWIR